MTGNPPQPVGTTSPLTSVKSKKRLRKMNAMFSQPTACNREKLQGGVSSWAWMLLLQDAGGRIQEGTGNRYPP